MSDNEKNIFKNKKVAIVGAAAYLQENNFGKAIDNADIVVRINKGPNVLSKDNSKHLGSKTHVVYHCLLEDPDGTSGLKNGFITPENWKNQGIKKVFCLPSSTISGYAAGNYLSNLVNIDKVKQLSSIIPVEIVDYRFYNSLSKELTCKPNTGIVALFHVLAQNPKQLNIYGFSFALDGWYKDYRDPELFDDFEWKKGEKINYEEAANRAFNSKRHKQKETWEYCKLKLLNGQNILLDPHMEKILQMKNFSREDYKKML